MNSFSQFQLLSSTFSSFFFFLLACLSPHNYFTYSFIKQEKRESERAKKENRKSEANTILCHQHSSRCSLVSSRTAANKKNVNGKMSLSADVTMVENLIKLVVIHRVTYIYKKIEFTLTLKGG